MEKETKDWKTVAEAFQAWQKETTEDAAGILLCGNKEGYFIGLQGELINIGLLLGECAEQDDDIHLLIKAAAKYMEILKSEHSAECTSSRFGEE